MSTHISSFPGLSGDNCFVCLQSHLSAFQARRGGYFKGLCQLMVGCQANRKWLCVLGSPWQEFLFAQLFGLWLC